MPPLAGLPGRLRRLAAAPPWFVLPLAAFLASRLVTLAAVYAARFTLPGYGIHAVLTLRWDASWYKDIALYGYPSEIPGGTGNGAQSLLGFFPLFPLLARAVGQLPGLSIPTAAIVVNFVGGAVACVLLWRLVADCFDRETANRAAVLFAFFPGSYAFTLAYTEGVFLACAVGCLLLLHRRRFWWAALVGGIGSASRPTGFVLAATCAAAVFLHWRETRDWRPLPSPLLAASGYIAFHAYLHVHTGDAFAWQRVQERGWGQDTDFGGTTLRRIVDYALHPNHDLNLLVPVLSVLAVIPLVWMLVRSRPPLPWLVFVGFSLLPGLLSTAIALTPRHLFAAFPLIVGAAWALRGTLYLVAVAVSSGVLTVLMLLTAGTFALTP